ncbi:phage major capsid protein [Halorubrum ezzemoulense]|uniref:phage major capsid protein n=1 Tax=Halorubrum ezzemoulense TaxID=337243 RepID=UPI00232C1ECE|nr:phage major capsid protein [Halorubrum ezzemoulense]MDB2283659.1 phage major capsid protein [Halorubrum ezzemoulense]
MSSTDTTDTLDRTREKNEGAAAKFDTTDVAGGVLPRDLFEQFYQAVQDTAMMLEDARAEDLPRQKMALPKISVGERQRRGAAEGEGDAGDATVNTSQVPMDVEKATVSYDLTREAVDDTVDNVDEIILDMLARQFAIDTQDLGINGDEADADAFLNQNDGWLKILQNDADVNTYDHTDGSGTAQPVGTDLFNAAILAMPNKYLRSGRTQPRFYMNLDQLQNYHNDLAQRNDPLGAAVLMGDDEATPFDYDVVGVANWPKDTAVFTHPQNFIYGLYDDVEIRVLTDTDKVAENDLFARYFMRVRDDFAVEAPEAAVLITGIAE